MFFKDGEITESGSHDNLIERKGDYYDLWTIQTGDINPTCHSNVPPRYYDSTLKSVDFFFDPLF